MIFGKIILFSVFAFSVLNGFSENKQKILFESSNETLVQTFDWAKKMALSYVHDSGDKVGPWYEAALPGRNAFCMRDVSHQSVPAEMLGLSEHNFNMMNKFAENISESKDYCTYWEIDKDNNPCSADYVDDDNFWYNLNANFDVIFACWRLYEWTGDKRYLNNTKMAEFYRLSTSEYVKRWQLNPQEIMSRPMVMNNKPGTEKKYMAVRGLPSYVENHPGLKVSSDLIASLYGGFSAYGNIMYELGDSRKAEEYRKIAKEYYNLLEKDWWNNSINAYHTFLTEERFADGEGLTYLLWFNVVKNTERIKGTIEKMKKRENWNIENVSHFPLLWFRYNNIKDAYNILESILDMPRKEYPETSFGMIEGIVSGMMGINPQASTNTISTLPKMSDNKWAEIKNVPVFGGTINVKHVGNNKTYFENNTGKKIIWEAAFIGDGTIKIDGKRKKTKKRTDIMGNIISYVNLTVANTENIEVVFYPKNELN